MSTPTSLKYLLILLAASLSLTGWKEAKKPHLIVGLWKITNEHSVTLQEPNRFINQLFFSGNEISSSIAFTNKLGEMLEKRLELAYRTYDSVEHYTTPVVYLINTCDKNFRLACSIERLTTDSLVLKYLKDISAPTLKLSWERLLFERIAGPPENMSKSPEAIQMEIRADQMP